MVDNVKVKNRILLITCSVLSNSLRPHGLQHPRFLCPSPSPRGYSCPLSQGCHPTIYSSVIPFSSCPQSFPESGSFLMNQLFISGGQTIGASASASVLPINIQGWFPLGLTSLILQSNRLLRVFSSTTVLEKKSISSSALSLLCDPTLTSIHDYWKNQSFDEMDFCRQSNVTAF